VHITGRGLNRATLARQLLLERTDVRVEDAVRQLVALQAQHAPAPYVALWNRILDLDPRDLDAAIARHDLVKATLLRITLHLVHAADHPTLRAAVRPTLRGARLQDRRFTATGLTAEDADALVPDLLAFTATPRSNAEVEPWLAERIGDAATWTWWALRSTAPLVHAPTGGPWSFGARPAYLTSPTDAVRPCHDPDVALQVLARRYLAGFGPASVADLAQFALVQRGRARAALRALGDDLEQLTGPGGAELYDLPSAPRPDEGTHAPPRLLGMWDSTLLAYHDRARIIPPDLRTLVIRRNGDVLATLLVDGYVAGVWRAAGAGSDGGIEVTAFGPLDEATWDAIAVEAAELVAFLADRDPDPFGRYRHWWAKLPDGDVRVLGR
jgi:hypothetical protein